MSTKTPEFVAPPEAETPVKKIKKIIPDDYTRIPFPVKAVQVTEDNLEAVAEWSQGTVRHTVKTVRDEDGNVVERIQIPFVKVDVHNPLSDRQTKAYINDWVLQSDTGFKVYTQRAFEGAFQRPADYNVADVDAQLHGTTEKYRDATNGEYVTHAYAKAHPETTVSETDFLAAKASKR